MSDVQQTAPAAPSIAERIMSAGDRAWKKIAQALKLTTREEAATAAASDESIASQIAAILDEDDSAISRKPAKKQTPAEILYPTKDAGMSAPTAATSGRGARLTF